MNTINVGSSEDALTCCNAQAVDTATMGHQHVLMELSEDFESYLERVTRKLVRRLIAFEGGTEDVLSQINMTSRLIEQLESQLEMLIVAGHSDKADVYRDPVPASSRPTWKEIGDALGVSAQAAHRKYSRRALDL